DLIQIGYEDGPPSPQAQGQVQLQEKAHVSVPVFPTKLFVGTIGSAVASDAGQNDIALVPKQGFGAAYGNATSSFALGTDPIVFSLSGSAQLVWNVDGNGLAQALAGKDQSSFQTIANGFAGIQEAHARIEPFWTSTFPVDPKSISVLIQSPAE